MEKTDKIEQTYRFNFTLSKAELNCLLELERESGLGRVELAKKSIFGKPMYRYLKKLRQSITELSGSYVDSTLETRCVLKGVDSALVRGLMHKSGMSASEILRYLLIGEGISTESKFSVEQLRVQEVISMLELLAVELVDGDHQNVLKEAVSRLKGFTQ